MLRGGAAGLLATGLAGCAGSGAGRGAAAPRPGFRAVAPSSADAVVVPEGYVATVLAAWGEPVGLAAGMPAFRADAGNTAAEQALQFGMHHDGMHFFPLDGGAAGVRRGLLVLNHEYVDDGLLHPDGTRTWDAAKTRKSQAAHGIAVAEVALGGDGRWALVRPSRHARRVTAATPIALGGPAAGHRLLRTAADPEGRVVLGTMANCGAGMTPWGTFLSGEENFQDYFAAADTPTAHERRWGLRRTSPYRWPLTDERFDAVRHPNEPNRFGWIVELDPFDPDSVPVKRTALGRGAHEGAWVAVTRDGRAVVYSGEDAAFECITRFVSRDPIRPGGAKANATLLDHGTLHVARFDADGRGRWLPLVHGQGPLTAANGFADQGEVLVRTRQAHDLLGATKMDRPEWMAVDPVRRWVYCALTGNAERGAAGRPGPDAANPRAANTMGHILRWQEDGDFDGATFSWQQFVLAGEPGAARPGARGNVRGDAFACPDAIAFDPLGMLWVATDVGPRLLGQGEMAPLGNNQLLACDPASGEFRRFLVGPVHCEITGMCFAPDGRTLFVNVQHPGETPGGRSDPDAPDRFSRWPDGLPGSRPRSATLAVRRRDGGVVGT